MSEPVIRVILEIHTEHCQGGLLTVLNYILGGGASL